MRNQELRLLEGSDIAADHHGEYALLSPGLATRHRSIEKCDTTRTPRGFAAVWTEGSVCGGPPSAPSVVLRAFDCCADR